MPEFEGQQKLSDDGKEGKYVNKSKKIFAHRQILAASSEVF
jgi:hypothetical protein